MRSLALLTAALLLTVGPVAFAQEKDKAPAKTSSAPKVTILFTGDNGGEVAPCG